MMVVVMVVHGGGDGVRGRPATGERSTTSGSDGYRRGVPSDGLTVSTGWDVRTDASVSPSM